jgi:hypothetical protein
MQEHVSRVCGNGMFTSTASAYGAITLPQSPSWLLQCAYCCSWDRITGVPFDVNGARWFQADWRGNVCEVECINEFNDL